ncbi:hypothetical protein [Teredinibacter sp. KSP-S5-2]|uniref:hypothetical protein n=1 Tax=Teredinibacter sp. KSP-S5-2 TaxID=3034506 RepID=UPI002934A1C9|nr:hypothetical protein [Teredinibacter sp. KSP-S5-2]WNO10360.1 hypothetical protein P5V12_04170 [Teredinibacter sp. KSP-S5-2]
MKLKLAEHSDLDQVIDLQRKYHVNSVSEEDKKDGFVTTEFTRAQLTQLIDSEQGLILAQREGITVGYAMAASWKYWSAWPMFQFMISELPNTPYLGKNITEQNSFQYGPVCIDKSVRGTGVLEALFGFVLEHMANRYPTLITFINKQNPRSYNAHSRKLNLDTVREFHFNSNEYYWLATSTQR